MSGIQVWHRVCVSRRLQTSALTITVVYKIKLLLNLPHSSPHQKCGSPPSFSFSVTTSTDLALQPRNLEIILGYLFNLIFHIRLSLTFISLYLNITQMWSLFSTTTTVSLIEAPIISCMDLQTVWTLLLVPPQSLLIISSPIYVMCAKWSLH